MFINGDSPIQSLRAAQCTSSPALSQPGQALLPCPSCFIQRHCQQVAEPALWLSCPWGWLIYTYSIKASSTVLTRSGTRLAVWDARANKGQGQFSHPHALRASSPAFQKWWTDPTDFWRWFQKYTLKKIEHLKQMLLEKENIYRPKNETWSSFLILPK